jgi:hypothetical protein
LPLQHLTQPIFCSKIAQSMQSRRNGLKRGELWSDADAADG